MDGVQVGIGATTAVGLSAAAYSIDAFARNGFKTSVDAAAHAPLRASVPAAVVGLALGAVAGAYVARAVGNAQREWVGTGALLGSATAVTGLGLGKACAWAARHQGGYLPRAELAGYAVPGIALAATVMLGTTFLPPIVHDRRERD